MNNSTLIAVVAVVIILGGGVLYFSSAPASAPQKNTAVLSDARENGGDTGDTSTTANEGGGVNVGVDVSADSTPTSASVNLDAKSFSPQSVTIKKGGSVTWTNQGGGQMWIASAQHPTHTAYSGTTLEEHCGGAVASFDQCKNGNSYSFTFNKAGTWNYHNHSNARQFGAVVVVE